MWSRAPRTNLVGRTVIGKNRTVAHRLQQLRNGCLFFYAGIMLRTWSKLWDKIVF